MRILQPGELQVDCTYSYTYFAADRRLRMELNYSEFYFVNRRNETGVRRQLGSRVRIDRDSEGFSLERETHELVRRNCL